jgi:membrane protease YdiL (CAAX protease family)
MDSSSAPLSELPMPAENPVATSPASTASKWPPRIVVMAVLFEGGLGLLGLLAGLFMSVPPWRLLQGRPIDVVYGLAATVPMLAALWAMRTARSGPLGRLNAIVDELVAPLFGKCTLLQLALISIVAGFGEEVLFRGAAQPLLIGWLSTIPGLIIASVVFGLMHAITKTYALLATLVGMYLGWLTLATNGLIAPIVAHALYDFLALVYLTRATRIPRVSDLRG